MKRVEYISAPEGEILQKQINEFIKRAEQTKQEIIDVKFLVESYGDDGYKTFFHAWIIYEF